MYLCGCENYLSRYYNVNCAISWLKLSYCPLIMLLPHDKLKKHNYGNRFNLINIFYHRYVLIIHKLFLIKLMLNLFSKKLDLCLSSVIQTISLEQKNHVYNMLLKLRCIFFRKSKKIYLKFESVPFQVNQKGGNLSNFGYNIN